MSKQYQRPPSSFVGYPAGSVKAFFFDRGIFLWATNIEGEMNAAESRAKNAKLARGNRARILENHLSKWEDPQKKAKRYRDPAAPKPKPQEPEDIVLGGDNFGRL